MGVRCTLLGHKYGDAEIEREREERGEEAVVTIREVETCSRCGNRSVVSENKEVTAAEAGAEVASPEDQDAAPTSEPRPTEPDSGDPVAEQSVDEAAVDDAGIDAGPEGGDDTVDAEEGAPAGADASAEEGPEHDPETDDGVILDDEPAEEEPAERQYGEWPDAEEDHASAEADPAAADADAEPEPWPDADEDADEGYDAAPPEGEAADVEYPDGADERAAGEAAADREDVTAGDAEASATDEGASTADEEASAEIEEPPVDDAEVLDDDEYETEAQPADEGAEFERAREAGSPSSPSTGGTELYCPACGYRDPSRDGSLREGDICPECRKGYLAAGE